MADSKLIVTSSDSNNRLVQKTFPNINLDADNSALKSFGQKVTALTDNTLSKVERLDKTDITTEKLTPSMTVEASDLPITRSAALAGKYVKVTYVGDGELSIVNNDNTTWATTFRKNPTSGDLYLYMGIVNAATSDNATAPHDIVIRSDETDDYYAGEFTFTISEG